MGSAIEAVKVIHSLLPFDGNCDLTTATALVLECKMACLAVTALPYPGLAHMYTPNNQPDAAILVGYRSPRDCKI